MQLRAYFVALFVIFVWGVTFVNTRALLADFSALEILMVRFGMAWAVHAVAIVGVALISFNNAVVFESRRAGIHECGSEREVLSSAL